MKCSERIGNIGRSGIENVIGMAKILQDYPDIKEKYLELALSTIPKGGTFIPFDIIEIAILAKPNGDLENKLVKLITTNFPIDIKNNPGNESIYNIHAKLLIDLKNKLIKSRAK